MSDIYFDTSAYLCLLLKEHPYKLIQAAIKNKKYFTSSLLFLEAQRCLVRLSRENILSSKDYDHLSIHLETDQDMFVIKDMTLDISMDPVFPPVSLPKSLDLIHLRTAIWFERQGYDIEFLTCDQNQRLAAKELGLKTIAL